MLSNRLLYELFSIEEFKKIEGYLSYYEIVNEEPLSILFSINVHSFTYEFIAEYPKYFPHQPIIIYRKTDFKTVRSDYCGSAGKFAVQYSGQNVCRKNTRNRYFGSRRIGGFFADNLAYIILCDSCVYGRTQSLRRHG